MPQVQGLDWALGEEIRSYELNTYYNNNNNNNNNDNNNNNNSNNNNNNNNGRFNYQLFLWLQMLQYGIPSKVQPPKMRRFTWSLKRVSFADEELKS